MKTRLTHKICGFLGLLTHFPKIALELLMPLRQARKKRADFHLQHLKDIDRKRLFGPMYYSHSSVDSHGETWAFLKYRDSPTKRCIWNFKYYLRPEYLTFFADMLSDEIIALLSDTLAQSHLQIPAHLIYCPSSAFAAGKRKHDQMKELAFEIEKRMNMQYPFLRSCVNVIMLAQNAKPQHFGNRHERLEWSKTRFTLSPEFKTYIQNLPHPEKSAAICIDDILTTGSTLAACSRLLTEAGFQYIRSMAICHANLVKKG